MVKRMRWMVPTILVGLMVVAAEGAGWALCDTCQVCKQDTHLTIPVDRCIVANNQPGSLCCQELNTGAGTYCYEYGSACYGIVVGGGGTGGSGGGGGGACTYQGGWCPAECMSCGSGGGGVLVL